MNRSLAFIFVVLAAVGLCSCASKPPASAPAPVPTPAPAETLAGDEFVYIASVHNTPQPLEPQPNTWYHVYRLLEKAGIRTIMTASGGVASISVESSDRAAAFDLLKKDSADKHYWIKFGN
jgi:hypothetical protein